MRSKVFALLLLTAPATSLVAGAKMTSSVQQPSVETMQQRYKTASIAANHNARQMKLLGLAACQFAYDKGQLSFNERNFRQELSPYVKSKSVFFADDAKNQPFSFNANLTGVNLDKFSEDKSAGKELRSTVLFYQGQNQRLDFRHNGYALVCFAPGNVYLVNKEEAKKLLWNAPVKFKK